MPRRFFLPLLIGCAGIVTAAELGQLRLSRHTLVLHRPTAVEVTAPVSGTLGPPTRVTVWWVDAQGKRQSILGDLPLDQDNGGWMAEGHHGTFKRKFILNEENPATLYLQAVVEVAGSAKPLISPVSRLWAVDPSGADQTLRLVAEDLDAGNIADAQGSFARDMNFYQMDPAGRKRFADVLRSCTLIDQAGDTWLYRSASGRDFRLTPTAPDAWVIDG